MSVSRWTDRVAQPSEPNTPTPDGFEGRLRVWVGLPANGATTPDPGGCQCTPERAWGSGPCLRRTTCIRPVTQFGMYYRSPAWD